MLKQNYLAPNVDSNPTAVALEEWRPIIGLIKLTAAQIREEATDLDDARRLATELIRICKKLDHSLELQDGTVSVNGNGSRNKTRPDSDEASTVHDLHLLKMREEQDQARTDIHGIDALSPRENQVFRALAEGYSVTEIAKLLNRSSKTINNHRTHILHKLKLRNTAELTRLAIRLKIVSA